MPTYPITGSAAVEVEARMGVARLAQTRLGFMDPLARVVINGTDRSSKIIKHSLRVELDLDRPATFTFETVLNPGFTPVEGQTVVIGIGSATNRLVAGHITELRQIHNPQGFSVRYSIACQDATWLLDKMLVNKPYAEQDAAHVVTDLIDTFTSGFTTNHVQVGLGSVTNGMQFTMEPPSRAMARIAQEVGAHSRVDPHNDVHFFVPSADNHTANPHDLSSSYSDYADVALTVDLSQVRTRVYVEGGGSTLADRWIASTDMFVLDNAMFDFPTLGTGNEGTLRVGSYIPLGSNRLRYDNADEPIAGLYRLQLLGGAEFDPLINYVLTSGSTEFEIGTPVNLLVQVNDLTAQAALAALDGSDGIRELYVQDRRLNFAGTTARATAELARWKNPIERLTYRTRDQNTRPGGVVTVNLGAPVNITGEFVIQRVTVQEFETGRYLHPWYVVEAASTQRTLWDILQDTLNKAI